MIVTTFPPPETWCWTKQTVIGCLTCRLNGPMGLGQWKQPFIPDLQPSVWRSGYARLHEALQRIQAIHPNPEGGAHSNAMLFDNCQQKNSECCEMRTWEQSPQTVTTRCFWTCRSHGLTKEYILQACALNYLWKGALCSCILPLSIGTNPNMCFCVCACSSAITSTVSLYQQNQF